MDIVKLRWVISKSALSVVIGVLTFMLYGCEQKQESAKATTTETTKQMPASKAESKVNHAKSNQETTNITIGALDTPPPVTRPQ